MDARKAVRDTHKELFHSISDGDEQTFYYVFMPDTVTKGCTKASRFIIHQIGFLDLPCILDTINDIKTELAILAANQKALSAFLPMFDKLQKDINNVTDYDKFTPWFTATTFGRSPFQKLLDQLGEISKSHKPSGPLCLELNNWLEGLYVHYSINAKRRQIGHLLQQQSKMVEFPIPEDELHDLKKIVFEKVPMDLLKKPPMQITKGRWDALKKVAEMKTEESQIILISVLRNVIDVLSQQKTPATQSIIAFAEATFKKLWEATELDYAGVNAQLAYLSTNRSKIIPELIELLKGATRFQKQSSILELSKELSFWLEGLFYYFYKTAGWTKDVAVNRKTGGEIPRVINIGIYYYACAVVLNDILSKPENAINVESEFATDLSHAPTTVPQVAMREVNGELEIIMRLPLSEKERAQWLYQLCLAMATPRVLLITPESIAKKLSENDGTSDENKIYGLGACLDKMVLSDALNQQLVEQVSARIETVMERYIASIESYFNLHKYYWTQNHVAEAKLLLTGMRQDKDFKIHLLSMFGMRAQLIKDNSGKLLPEIDRILLDVYGLLRSTKQYQAEPPVLTLMDASHSALFSPGKSTFNPAIAASSAAPSAKK
ncbi:MAG: hypothetical protein WAW86_01845 [Gammaproteobacteria bacterium]